MPTTLYLRDALATGEVTDLGGVLERLLLPIRGAASTTAVTTTTAAGTSITGTQTAGGSIVHWYSPPLYAVTILGAITPNIRGLESALTVNAGRSIRIVRATANGSDNGTMVVQNITGVHGTEFTASDAANGAWSITPTSQPFADGERIKVILYVANVGTMAAGSVTYTYGGPTAAAAGDSYITFTETLNFIPPKKLRPPRLQSTNRASSF